MNLQAYLEKKRVEGLQNPTFKERCYRCMRTETTCYCSMLKPFDPKISFVILIHPLEFKRRIATGRMSHLLLKNSHLLLGIDFSENKELNFLINDKNYQSYLLFPGSNAINLSSEKKNINPEAGLAPQKKLRIIVLDGTWSTAKTMLRLSPNLQEIPQVAFVPPRLSNFRIRKQPKKECFSTIEAIHHVIELVGADVGFDVATRRHDHLLEVFTKTVDQHIAFNVKARESGNKTLRYKVRKKSSSQ